MKTLSGSVRFAGCQSTKPGIFCLALILGAAMFAVGCGKGKSAGPVASPTPPPAQNTNPAPAATPAATPPVNLQLPSTAVATATNGQPDLGELNRQYITYVIQNHHGFKTVEEFAAAMNIQLPPPPAGKKYAFNKKGYIVLVDQ